MTIVPLPRLSSSLTEALSLYVPLKVLSLNLSRTDCSSGDTVAVPLSPLSEGVFEPLPPPLQAASTTHASAVISVKSAAARRIASSEPIPPNTRRSL